MSSQALISPRLLQGQAIFNDGEHFFRPVCWELWPIA
jgi:hypothetical protein